jgi:hypothetical protein
MPTQVIISSAVNITPPFSGTACDVYGNNCSYIGSGSTFPIVFTLPSQFNTAPAFQLTLVDSLGCSVSEIIYCSTDEPKQFQNMEYFVFMGGDLYQFQ